MNIGFRIFHHRTWELKFCEKYGLAIEYRIDSDSEFQDGLRNSEMLKGFSNPVFFHYPSNGESIWFSHSFEEERIKAIKKFERYIELCRKIGANKVIIHDETPFGGIQPYQKSLREISRMSREAGIKICIENAHLDPFSICSIIANISDIYIALDLGHANIQMGNEGIIEFIERYGYRVEHIHLHDNHGIHDEHLIPGEGTLDYEKIFKKLKEAGFEGFGILELNWGIETEYGIRRSIKYLNKFINKNF